jgi:hypothetical protein
VSTHTFRWCSADARRCRSCSTSNRSRLVCCISRSLQATLRPYLPRESLTSLCQACPLTPSCRYSRYVTKSILKIDTLLKVIMTPEEPAEDFVQHYLLLVPCQSFSDFQKVLDLKVRPT